SKLAVPGRNDDRHGAQRLCLARKTNQRFWFSGLDVAKLFDLLSFARRHVRKLLSAAEHTNPTGAARSRSTFDRDWSFDATRIDGAPVARLIFRGAPREVLAFTQFVFCACVILVPRHRPLLVDRFQKPEDALTVVFCAFSEDLLSRLFRVLTINHNSSR